MGCGTGVVTLPCCQAETYGPGEKDQVLLFIITQPIYGHCEMNKHSHSLVLEQLSAISMAHGKGLASACTLVKGLSNR